MSPEENSTFERLRQMLAKKFEVAPELIHPTARMDQLGIDSLAVIEVMFMVEDEFKINFPQDPGEVQTLGDLASCVDRLTAQQPARASQGEPAP